METLEPIGNLRHPIVNSDGGPNTVSKEPDRYNESRNSSTSGSEPFSMTKIHKETSKAPNSEPVLTGNCGNAEDHIVSEVEVPEVIRPPGSRSSSRRSRNSNISPASMIFRNLLILEDDLRRQARAQRWLKWQFTGFLLGLAFVGTYAAYQIYWTPKPATGFYRFTLQFALCLVLVTFVLFHLSGQYRRTIVLPRRFFSVTNKGLRQFNIKLVKVDCTWDDSCTDTLRLVGRALARIMLSTIKRIPWVPGFNLLLQFWRDMELRSQPRLGAVDLKLVLNPRSFSAEIREGWEIYRDEFWARETVRRRNNIKDR